MREYYLYGIAFMIALLSAALLFPAFLKISRQIGFVDRPNQRKVHRHPVPVIGGLVIMMSLLATIGFSAGLQWLAERYLVFGVCLLVLLITGVVDDRLNISPLLRFAVQIGTAVAVAYDGMRLQSLHGLFGIHELSIFGQYFLTVLIVVGVTNAFNLIDGINGLAGGLALVNVLTLAALAVYVRQNNWLFFLLPLSGALLVFLRYNWKAAKLFMGDGGSLVLGFALSVIGISLIRSSYISGVHSTELAVVVVSGCCMIPVVDTIRVFYARISRGRSPFSADKNHLHHLFLRHRLTHAQAAARILVTHVLVLALSVAAIQFAGLLWVICGQILLVGTYTWFLQLFTQFVRNYRFIKRLETAG